MRANPGLIVNLFIDLIDECATSLHNCHANAVCTDLENGFTCACSPAYAGDGRTCIRMTSELRSSYNLLSCDDNSTCDYNSVIIQV